MSAVTHHARNGSPLPFCRAARPQVVDDRHVTLPAELLLAVARSLEAKGLKLTLLHLLSTCRGMLFLGVGLLVRGIEAPAQVPRGDDGGRALDRYRGLLSDALGTGKLSNVKELSVTVYRRDTFYVELLRRTGASLATLEVVAQDRAGVEELSEAIGAADQLERVFIRTGNPQADPFLPLLRHLNGLETLREIGFDDLDVSWTGAAQGSRGWSAAFREFPSLASRLGSIALDDDKLPDWAEIRLESIERVHCRFNWEPWMRDGLGRILDAFRNVRFLDVQYARTGTLLESCNNFRQLVELSASSCELDLSSPVFPRVRSAVEVSGLRLSIAPDWELMASLAAVGIFENWRNEEAFWLGTKGVEIETFDRWEELREELDAGTAHGDGNEVPEGAE